VRPHEAEQLVLALAALGADLGEARRDDTERFDPELECLLGGLEDMQRWQAEDREVRHLGQLAERRVPTHAADRLAVAVDRVGRTLEVGRQDIAEELPADRSAPAGCADDRQRARREERPQRRSDRGVVALVDAHLERLGRGDREANLDLAAVKLARDLEARVAEDLQHRRVLGQHLGDEALDPCRRRAQCQLLEQARPDPAALVLVRDRERDFGGGLVAQPHEFRDGDDLVTRDAEQHAAVVPVRLDEVLHEHAVDAPDPVEAQVQAAL
jgi:hypothetical protein